MMQERSEVTRASILDAAEKEFSNLGFYGARVDAIAQSSGVNKALIYKYFGNKEDLYKIVFNNVYNRFTELEKSILQVEEEDYKAKIRKFVEMEFDFCLKNNSYVRMIMWENLNNGKFSSESLTSSTKSPILISLKQIISQVNKTRTKPLSINEYDLLLNLYSCCFFYFTNMRTMSGIMNEDLSSEKMISHRVDVVTDYLISYLEENH